VLPSADDSTAAFTIPFSFTFYATSGTAGWVSSNGVVGLGSLASTAFSNLCIPSASAPLNAIFAYWDDLYTRSTGVCYGSTGSAPNRKFVITFSDAYFCCLDTGLDHLTMSVILTEGTNTVDLVYQTLGGSFNGGSATIGVQNAAGTVATQQSCNAAGITAGTAIRFTGM
jgi:hypothetical protein